MSDSVTREEPGDEGVIILRDVPLVPAESPEIDAIIHLQGVDRNLGGFIVRVYHLGDDVDEGEELTREHPRFLGELFMYASMAFEVPERERIALPADTPEPLPIEPYDTFIDISDTKELLGDAESADLTLALTTTAGEPVPAEFFRSADISIQINREPKTDERQEATP